MTSQTDTTSAVIHGAKDVLGTAMKSCADVWNMFDNRYDLNKIVNRLTHSAQMYPALSVFVAVVVLLCSIPVLVFVFFAAVTIGLSFLGFIFVEGTLLTFGLFFLSGALLFVGLFAISIGGVLAISYLCASSAYGVLQSFMGKPALVSTSKTNGALHNGYATDLQKVD